jgi:hypothetical protein
MYTELRRGLFWGKEGRDRKEDGREGRRGEMEETGLQQTTRPQENIVNRGQTHPSDHLHSMDPPVCIGRHNHGLEIRQSKESCN